MIAVLRWVLITSLTVSTLFVALLLLATSPHRRAILAGLGWAVLGLVVVVVASIGVPT